MATPTQDQIRARAYQLWKAAGKPEGREDEFGIKRSASYGAIPQTTQTKSQILFWSRSDGYFLLESLNRCILNGEPAI